MFVAQVLELLGVEQRLVALPRARAVDERGEESARLPLVRVASERVDGRDEDLVLVLARERHCVVARAEEDRNVGHVASSGRAGD